MESASTWLCKRRTWRKVHLAIDTAILDVIGVTEWVDCEVFEGLLDQIESTIEQINNIDGVYGFMPPRANASRP